MAIPLLKPIATIDLRSVIRAYMDDHTDAIDPGVIAEGVLAEIDADDAMDALAQCLPGYVGDMNREKRRAENKQIGPARSLKCEMSREKFQGGSVSILRQQSFFTGTGWKHYDDCTPADVLFIADAYGRRKNENAYFETKHRAVHADLVESGAATVRDLPDDALNRAHGS